MEPRKELGQHFLRDDRTVRAILDAAKLERGQRVLEVGPGPGVITLPMAQRIGTGTLVVIEADARFAKQLRQSGPANMEVHHGDAVVADLESMGPFDRIVANLPYLISGPITVRFLDLLKRPETRWKRAVLMYQKEFADRLLAGPGSRTYGRLSVQTARYCNITRLREVSPACFDPPPKVRSTILVFEPHTEEPFAVQDDALWNAVIDGTFLHRRKQLHNTLPSAVAAFGLRDAAGPILENLGWGERRPESLAPAEFAQLVNELAEART